MSMYAVISQRTTDAKPFREGSGAMSCDRCGEMVWVEPHSATLLDEDVGLDLLCWQCAWDEAGDDQEAVRLLISLKLKWDAIKEEK